MYKGSESIIVTMAFEYGFPTQTTTTTTKIFGYFSKNQISDMFQTTHAGNIYYKCTGTHSRMRDRGKNTHESGELWKRVSFSSRRVWAK